MERVLTLIRFRVDMLRTSSRVAGFALLKNAIAYMRNYPGLAHHPTEEIIFTRLVDFAPATRALCVRLLDQHKEFGRQETILLRHIRRSQDGNMQARRRLLQVGTAYCVDHADHIRSEEDEAFPQAIKWLPETEWREIGNHAMRLITPFSDEGALDSFESLYDYLMDEGGKFDLH